MQKNDKKPLTLGVRGAFTLFQVKRIAIQKIVRGGKRGGGHQLGGTALGAGDLYAIREN